MRLVDAIQTRPIAFRVLWELSGNDLTQLSTVSGEEIGASSH
jgi:hypothetical protein